jgi:hypothetical protein
MNEEYLAELINQLKWLRASIVNNTVKQVEVACVRRLGRSLTPEEKELIHRDCLEETAEIRGLIDKGGFS